jgi:hypothetical protein
MHEGDEFSVMSVVPGTEISVFAPLPPGFFAEVTIVIG